jgi:hypothetical protein
MSASTTAVGDGSESAKPTPRRTVFAQISASLLRPTKAFLVSAEELAANRPTHSNRLPASPIAILTNTNLPSYEQADGNAVSGAMPRLTTASM